MIKLSIFFAITIFASYSIACQCMEETEIEAARGSKYVFLALVTERQNENVQFELKKSIKGTMPSKFRLRIPKVKTTCDLLPNSFSKEIVYLMTSHNVMKNAEGEFEVSIDICSLRVDSAGKEKIIKKIEKELKKVKN